ncbi:MAG: hypothetical protein J6B77_08245, partial [Clostridia bacterium]|nr:hypothetical protein [Clostridia bacterium]
FIRLRRLGEEQTGNVLYKIGNAEKSQGSNVGAFSDPIFRMRGVLWIHETDEKCKKFRSADPAPQYKILIALRHNDRLYILYHIFSVSSMIITTNFQEFFAFFMTKKQLFPPAFPKNSEMHKNVFFNIIFLHTFRLRPFAALFL